MGKHSLPDSPGFWRAVVIAGFRYLLIIILLGAVGFSLYRLLLDRDEQRSSVTEEDALPAFPSDPSPLQTGSPFASTPSSPVQAGGKTQVLDGAQSPAKAEQAAGKLEQARYEVVARATTSRPYEKTTVFYQPGSEQTAEAVAGLIGATVIQQAVENLDKSIPITVVVGRDFAA